MNALASCTAAIPIFDIDTHRAEPADLWTARAPAKYKGRTLHVKTRPNGEGWFIGDHYVTFVGPSVIRADMTKQLCTSTLYKFEEMVVASYDASARLNMMDQLGITAAVVYPNVIGFGAQTLMRACGT
ncbi:MAG: hypothetical protein ABW110_01750 [Steroidobacteraceae bacterium]